MAFLEEISVTWKILALLGHANVPLKYWDFAIKQSSILLNVLPSNVINKKFPYQILFNENSNYLAFKPFGCLAF